MMRGPGMIRARIAIENTTQARRNNPFLGNWRRVIRETMPEIIVPNYLGRVECEIPIL